MAKSSINFQKSSGHSYDHNFRKDSPNYLLKAENRLENFYWQNEKSAREIFDDELSRAKRKGGRIPSFENSHWEAVVNLNKNHTLEDVQKVARYIEQKFNITCATIAVHRDEGHYKNDKPQYNFHAHITFVTYKDGQQNWRKEKIKPSDLAKLQTAVAEILQMERGQENSKAERLSHRQYKKAAQEKEQLEAEILTLKEQNERIEKERKESKGQEYSTKEYHSELGAIKKNKQRYTAQQLEQLLDELKEKHKRLFGINHEAVEKELIDIIAQQNEQLKELDEQRRNENERLQRQQEQQAQQLSQELKQKDEIIKAQNVQISELEAENTELKSFIKRAFDYVRKNSSDIFAFVKNIFTNAFTEPLLNELEKDKEFIDQDKKTQQRANLTPLQPDNNQEQEIQQTEQPKVELPQERSFKPKIHRR